VAVRLAARSGVSVYSYLAFYQEWSAIRDALRRNRPTLYHVLYGDDTYRYLGWLGRRRKRRVLATYHQPPSRLASNLHFKGHLARLDGVIVVGGNQIPFFESVIAPDRIHLVPHGVDTAVFSPAAVKRPEDSKPTCLFVGQHRRDFETLRQVISLALKRNPDVQFIVVTAATNRDSVPKTGNVCFRSNLPETELVKLYQSAALLLQPLEDCTANNAILEGMACGLPIVASDVGAIRDYADEQCAMLVPPQNAEAMAEAVFSLLGDGEKLGRFGRHARTKALQFDWSVIVRELRRVYREVMSA
jgi:glycosyltransferase involved in cell wall biosynthesis